MSESGNREPGSEEYKAALIMDDIRREIKEDFRLMNETIRENYSNHKEDLKAVVDKYDKTLFGEDGRGGLCGESKDIKNDVESTKTVVKAWAAGLVVAGGVLLSVFGVFFYDLYQLLKHGPK